jgi:hypothetical protein
VDRLVLLPRRSSPISIQGPMCRSASNVAVAGSTKLRNCVACRRRKGEHEMSESMLTMAEQAIRNWHIWVERG